MDERTFGKRVSVYYDDSSGKVSRHDGVLVAFRDNFVIIDFKVMIPIYKVVRIEVRT